MKKTTLILFTFLLALGCANDPQEPVCGAGDSFTLGGATYCFAENALVIETGFKCPVEAPSRFEGPSGVVCAPAGVSAKDLPKELCTKAGDESCVELKLVSVVDGSTVADSSVSQDATIGESDGGRCTTPEQWFERGCEGDGTDEYVVAAGGECLETCESESCGPGRRCAMTSVKPACVKDGCDACANHIGVCVADHTLTFSGSSSVDGNGIVVWPTNRQPDYAYAFGRFSVTSGSLSLSMATVPPADALHSGRYGEGFGVGLMVVSRTADLHQIPEGRINDNDTQILQSDANFDSSTDAAGSCDYAIIYTDGRPTTFSWLDAFPVGYSCASVTRTQGNDDTFEPVPCDDVELSSLCNSPDWT